MPSPYLGGALLLWLVVAISILVSVDTPASVADEIASQLVAGEIPDWKLETVTGLFWGAVANVVIVTISLVTMRWWCRLDTSPRTRERSQVGGMSLRVFVSSLMLLVLLAGALRWKLANGSLWWDEMWNVKMATVGEFRTGSRHPDEQRFYPTDIARCLWYYKKPTNHVPTALASKFCHNVWSRATGAEDGVFSEFIIRLPVFMSALGSVMLIGFCVRRWVGAGVGLLAAFLLAIHPWFIRYGIDARAYGPVVFFTLVALWSLHRAVLGDRYRHWVLFGFAQFMLMWSNLHSMWFCTATTSFAGMLLWEQNRGTIRSQKLGRLIAVNALAAGAFLQVFAPNLIQLHRSRVVDQDGSFVGPDMIRSSLSQVFVGMEPEWPVHGIEVSGLVSWASLTGDNLWMMWLSMFLALGVMVAGLVLFWRKDRPAACLVLALFAGASVFFLTAWALEIYFYHRFLSSLLPAIVIALAAGLWQIDEWLSVRFLAGKRGVFAIAGGAVFLIVCFPQIRVLQQRSYAPMREVAQFLQQLDQNEDGGVIVLGYGLGSRLMRVYNRDVESTHLPPGDKPVEEALRRATEQEKPLYVFYGYPIFNRMMMPKGFEKLDDPARFEEIAGFGGIEPEFYFRVLEAKLPR